MVRKRRVLLLYSNDLLLGGIKSLLEGEDGLELLSVNAREPGAVKRLKQLRPAVVVADKDGPEEVCSPVHVLRECPTALVIHFGRSDTGMNLYYGRRVESAGLEDLKQAILGYHQRMGSASRKGGTL